MPARGGPGASFRADRSISLPPPPPGFAPLRPPASPPPPAPSSRYKTELCRTFRETGRCKYGAKCQFAHGPGELRALARHPKYKTELCHKFYRLGQCPYGARCNFIHHLDEERSWSGSSPPALPPLRQSLSYSGTPQRRPSPPPGLPDPAGFARAPSPVCRGATLGETPLGSGGCLCSCLGHAAPFSWDSLVSNPPPELLALLPRAPSSTSLSDRDGDSSGSESPVFEPPATCGAGARRLPIFNRLSVSE